MKPVTEGGNVTISAVANADVANVMARGDVDAALASGTVGSNTFTAGSQDGS